MRNARHRDQIGRTAGVTPSYGKVTLATAGLLTSRVVAACSPSQIFLQRPSGFVEQAARRLQLRGQFRFHTGIPFSPRRINAAAPSLYEVVNLARHAVNSGRCRPRRSDGVWCRAVKDSGRDSQATGSPVYAPHAWAAIFTYTRR